MGKEVRRFGMPSEILWLIADVPESRALDLNFRGQLLFHGCEASPRVVLRNFSDHVSIRGAGMGSLVCNQCFRLPADVVSKTIFSIYAESQLPGSHHVVAGTAGLPVPAVELACLPGPS